MIWILLSVSVLVNVVLGLLLFRAARRLLQFDDLYELLVHDIDTNIAYFAKLQKSPLLTNSQEVLDMHRNMSIIRQRLDEYVLRMQELVKRELRRKPPERLKPPVVVD